MPRSISFKIYDIEYSICKKNTYLGFGYFIRASNNSSGITYNKKFNSIFDCIIFLIPIIKRNILQYMVEENNLKILKKWDKKLKHKNFFKKLIFILIEYCDLLFYKIKSIKYN